VRCNVASKQGKKKTRPTQVQRVNRDSNRNDFAWLRKRIAIFGITTIFLLHVLGLALLFSPVVASINHEPLIDQDWGLHFHHLKSLETFWRRDTLLWGYNPFFMAGYPSNTIQDLSIKFFELLSLALAAVVLSSVQWFKICAFVAMASVPWIMYLAARNFFFADQSKNLTGAAAAVLGTVYWWNSLPREMFFYGMLGFPVASYLSILGVSLFYRIAKQSRSFGPVHIGLLIFALAILPLHVQSVVIFLPPVVALILTENRLLSVRISASIIAVAALSLLLNAWWLIPAITHRGDDISAQIVRQLPLFVSSDPLTFVKDYLGSAGYWSFRPSFLEKGFRVVLLVLGGLGIWKLIRNDKRDAGIMLATGTLVLFVITYFGALAPLTNSWQPLRFKVPYDLFLVIGASYSIGNCWSARVAAPSRILVLLLAAGLVAFFINVFQTESTGKLQLRSRINPGLNEIVEWVHREASRDGRVLFEESGDETGFVYDGVYLSSFLPHLTGRQLIGGPINLYNDRHHFAEFHSGKLFQKQIQTFSDEGLRNYFRLYNIAAIVAFHPASVRRFLAIPDLVRLDQRVGPVHLFKVNQPLSWFVKGAGQLKASLNRIEVSNVNSEEIILKFHWHPRLVALPEVKSEPIMLQDDPIPFIRIVNPPAAFTLRISP
jgi:hypothetical protein